MDKEVIGTGMPENQTHYLNCGVQPIELMFRVLTPEEFKGFLKGNMIKYAMRAGKKQGESADKDTEKFIAYSDWLNQFEESDAIEIDGETLVR